MKKFALASLVFCLSVGAFAQNKLFSTPDKKFTISMTGKWISADPNNAEYKKYMGAIKKNNPGMASAMRSDPGSALHLFDTGDSASDGFVDNFNLRVIPNFDLTPSMHKPILDQVKSMLTFVGPINSETVMINGAQALHYWGTINMKVDAKSSQKYDVAGFMFSNKKTGYVLTFACSNGQMKTKRAKFKAAAQSSRVR